MKYHLNPVFETFSLLCFVNSGANFKKEIIKQLDDFGVNGTAFYAVNYPTVERYYDLFASQMIETDGCALIREMCDDIILLLIAILLLHPKWLDDFSSISDKEVTTVVHNEVACFLESTEDLIDALEKSELSDQGKWQITALLQQPKKKLALVIEAINSNLAAFEYAKKELASEITPLLKQFEGHIEKNELSPYVRQALALNPSAQIIPSLAVTFIILTLNKYCFVGLLLNKISTGQTERLTEVEAALVAKSLSDASKLDILHTLKHNELYNLEIAQKLGLTQATISHHMNMLLAAGLVKMSRKGAKTYYSLCADGIKRYCDWLHEGFL